MAASRAVGLEGDGEGEGRDWDPVADGANLAAVGQDGFNGRSGPPAGREDDGCDERGHVLQEGTAL